jgi:hypothetical protein
MALSKDRPGDAIPGLDAWKPWEPKEAAARLADIGAPWCVAGGWALDLWRGKQTRPHSDLEIAILRHEFEHFRARLGDFKLFAVGSGDISPLAPDAYVAAEKHQVWVLDDIARAWRMDIFLEVGDRDTWVFRRNAAIRRSRSRMIAVTADGVPYLRPEGVLLYKAKATRAKDAADFEVCAPLLEPEARAWLCEALARAHPGHPWIGRLDAE